MSEFGQCPAPQDLQFEHAEPLPERAADPSGRSCVICKTPIGDTYFHAQGQVVCPMCAERIQSGQQAPPAISLGRATLYGAGAALVGCILYAAVAILLNLEIGIVAIVVGVIVGKAVRAGSRGLGGRPQQILAVLLTYFAITTSYIPVFFHEMATNPQVRQQARQSAEKSASNGAASAEPKRQMGFVAAIVTLLLLFAAAPFFGLTTGVGGFISLFIIFIGLKQAWKLTGRTDLLIMGPYSTAPAE